MAKLQFSSEEERREYYRELGRRGGRANVAKNGRGHMSRIGRRGHEVTTRRYFQGSLALHHNWLSNCGLFHIVKATGLPPKYDRDGNAIWPTEADTVHPANDQDHVWF